MTDQLYLAMGLPSLVALAGVEDKLDVLTGKVAEIDNRVIRIEDKLGIVPR